MTRKKIEEREPLVPILFGEITTSVKHKMAKQAKGTGRNWYVLHTYSGYEDAVEKAEKMAKEAAA